MKRKLLFCILLILISKVNAQSIKKDLVASYAFEGNLRDTSGNNFHGVGTSISYTTDRNGIPNSAIYCNGNNSHVVIPYDSLINRNQWTYMAWVAADATAPTSTIISVGGATNISPGDGFEQSMSFINGSTPQFFAGGYNQGSSPVQSQIFGNSTKVQWHHVVATRDSQKVRLYIDGKQVIGNSSANTNGQLANYGSALNKRAVIGSIARLGVYYFKGKIDEVNLYKISLNDSLIDSIYKSYFVKSKDEPIMFLFNGNTKDSGIYAQHATNNGAVFVKDRFGRPNSALQFDGINSHLTIPYDSLLNLNEYSYSAWIKVDSTLLSSATIVSVGGATNMQAGDGFEQGMSFVIDQEETYFGGSYNYGNNPNQSKIYTTRINRNVWDHVVYVRSQDSLRIYLNGKKQPSQPNSVVNNQIAHYGNSITKRAVIGSIARLGQYYFKGQLDDVFLYMKALDSAQVMKLYNSFPPYAQPEDTILIAQYPFNESYDDVSGNNNHATNFGSMFVDDRQGKPGSAIFLEGSDHLIITNKVIVNKNNYSISMWIAASPYQNNNASVFSAGSANSNPSNPGLGQSVQYLNGPTKRYKLNSFNKIGTPVESNAITDSLNVLAWHHIMVTRGNAQVRIYVDGLLADLDSTNYTNGLAASFGADSIKRVVLGTVSSLNGNYFSGYIDDLTIFGKELDSMEVSNWFAKYDKYIAVGSDKTKVLKAKYPLDGNALDVSTNTYHGTIVGAQPTTDRFGQTNSALQFDGIDDYVDIPFESVVGNETYTISAWIKPESNNSQNFTVFSAGGANNQNPGDGFEQSISCINFDNQNFSIFGGSYNHSQTPIQSQITSGRIRFNEWHHVVYLRTPEKLRLFVDGNEVPQQGNSGVHFQHAHYGYYPLKRATIGSIARLGEYYYKGAIDDIQIFKGNLSDSAINQLYVPLGTNVSTLLNEDQILISPNPNDGNFVLQGELTTKPFQVEIFNSNGALIFRETLPSNSRHIDAQNRLTPGLYIINAKSIDGQKQLKAKFLVQ